MPTFLFQNFHGFTNGDIVEAEAVYDDAIELSHHFILRGCGTSNRGALRRAIFTDPANRLFPSAIGQPEHLASGFIVGLVVITGALLVYLLHALAGSDVVGIKI